MSTPFWWPATINPTPPELRPLAAYELYGLGSYAGQIWALDAELGYILALDREVGVTAVMNRHLSEQIRNWTALTIAEDAVWLAIQETVYAIPIVEIQTATSLAAYARYTLPTPIEGLAVNAERLYATSARWDGLLAINRANPTDYQVWDAPGHGRENCALINGALWVCDRYEDTIYVLDANTGAILAQILSPQANPTGLTLCDGIVYVSAASREPYIHDNPNNPDPLSVATRPKTTVSPLRLHIPAETAAFRDPEAVYTLSQGHRLELTYLEELKSEEPLKIENLTWTIALPDTTRRQIVRDITPVGGVPCRLEDSVATFSLGSITDMTAGLFGWRAILDVYSLKFSPQAVQTEGTFPPEYAARYLIDDDDLTMGTSTVQAAAREAIAGATDVVSQMLNIRNYVYDKLSYRLRTTVNTPESVLRNGEGNCGEYVGTILALARLNGIPCRTAGRYKCPPHSELKHVPLFPEYNHVWVEFYLPGWGWLPLESNPDDTGEAPYPQRHFMGLPWTHAEIGRGRTFETCTPSTVSVGRLAINHVQFRILEAL